MPDPDPNAADRDTPALPSGAITAGLAVAAFVAAGAHALSARIRPEDSYLLPASAAYALLATAIAVGLVRSRPMPAFGPANTVTLLRAGMVCLLAALIGEPWDEHAWWVAGLAIVALSLDGVDGWLARRYGPMTAFGARFDMEADAALVMVLALLAWQAGLAGAWVLLAGLWRYAFIAAARVLRWLDRPLPDSFRRKLVCVLQLVGLIACIAPTLPPAVRTACAAIAVLLVSISFLIDIAWLVRHRPARRLADRHRAARPGTGHR